MKWRQFFCFHMYTPPKTYKLHKELHSVQTVYDQVGTLTVRSCDKCGHIQTSVELDFRKVL